MQKKSGEHGEAEQETASAASSTESMENLGVRCPPKLPKAAQSGACRQSAGGRPPTSPGALLITHPYQHRRLPGATAV